MLNPITYTEKTTADFLRYQLTTYPFADERLHAQLRTLLNLEQTRHSPLLKGPYVTLSKSFRQGAAVRQLVAAGILHPHMPEIARFPILFSHQEEAIRAIHAGRPTLVSTGTGSGKTESFLYPIISHCLSLRDQNAPPGITAVIVYPMNALAEDQLDRLREFLAGTGVTFGMYIGKTPETDAEFTGLHLPQGSSRADYKARLEARPAAGRRQAIAPWEERVSREAMRAAPPRILLTNVKQLELLLTRQRDIALFDGARLDYLVFDEAHTFSGAGGAETAVLIRRLRTYCNRTADETICIATSATIVDPEHGQDAGRDFAARFFGVDRERVALVTESYEPDQWAPAAQRTLPDPFPGNITVQLQNVLDIVDAATPDEDTTAARILGTLLGMRLTPATWRSDLFDYLSRNELAYQLVGALDRPRELPLVLADLAKRVNRPLSEEELLLWLALGAAARKEDRPFMRPVVHAFVRGIAGAVVTFPEDSPDQHPRLWLSALDAAADDGDYRLPVLTCTTCGQHYFEHFLQDFTFTDPLPGGGEQTDHGIQFWRPLDKAQGGRRLVLLDQLISAADEDDSDTIRNTQPLWLCGSCGTLHSTTTGHCAGCGRPETLVRLSAVQQKSGSEGQLTRCLSCGTNGGRGTGGRYREPIKPVRATTVSDVHVLAQNMLQHAERKRLLVFSDNRQDAAFQAGWMQDHARRFRLRSLMYARVQQGAVSVGDLTAYLDRFLDADDDLSQSLIPEVWRTARKEHAGLEHSEARKQFLRIQVLREIALGLKQRLGLEPWGRIEIEYLGLTPDTRFIREWATRLSLDPAILCSGIAALLDLVRRDSTVYDRDTQIFSRYWNEGDREIQYGYFPLMPNVPNGLKLSRDRDDSTGRVRQWLSTSARGTRATNAARAWGVPAVEIGAFFNQLWDFLTIELELLIPVTLIGFGRKPLRGTHGVYQLDADKFRIAPHRGFYRCQTCRRTQIHATPYNACIAWNCSGTLALEDEQEDDYDLMVLDEQFTLIRPEEHSAQVPAVKREFLERAFKSETSHIVNTLVATPTLEMGVDIGGLDAVLMRNVPPLPANYWQRAGRAGRRHRMAMNMTYARNASHDRAYFEEPLKLLNGAINPPRINLRNELMVKKHVHAAVLTRLNQLERDLSLPRPQREQIAAVIDACFPTYVSKYLFQDNGNLRQAPLDVGSLATLIARHRDTLLAHIRTIFAQWPAADAAIVTPDRLQAHLDNMHVELATVIQRIWRRLQWALKQMDQLDKVRSAKGALDPAEEALRARCNRLIKKLKGTQSRRRSEAEGYDDTYTYGVLAAEGFLPGYGLSTGSILGTAQSPPSLRTYLQDIDLPRPPAVALREYAPGNLLYANGSRFVPRQYHLEPDEPILYQVDIENEAVIEVGVQQDDATRALGAQALSVIPMVDVDMPHVSTIGDDEEFRFQMPVMIFGHERQQHSGGTAYQWGSTAVHLRHNVHLRLVNIGAGNLVAQGQLGYPISLVSGDTRSPFASETELSHFDELNLKRYGRSTAHVGFSADVIADALSLNACANRTVAYSIAEALRMGAANTLEMELDDLQLLCIGSPGAEQVDILLYDPMPGGSGLLEQMLDRWPEVITAALHIVAHCPSACETSCIDCLQTYRNAFYHRYLNRHEAREALEQWGTAVHVTHTIPELRRTTADTSGEMPVNQAEQRLFNMIQRAGLPTPAAQHRLELPRPLSHTTPDFYYGEEHQDHFQGICIYLDGLSRHIHGNENSRRRDQQIREWLRNNEYQVITIPASDLDSREVMRDHLYTIARYLLGRTAAREAVDTTDWFVIVDTQEETT